MYKPARKIKARSLRTMMSDAAKAFFKTKYFKAKKGFLRERARGGEPFDKRSYYATLKNAKGIFVLSPQPYTRWSEARRAAKRIHSSGFLMKGTTLNKHFANHPTPVM